MRLRTIGLSLAAGLALGAGAANAEPKARDRAATVQKLMDCRTVTDSAARLACYDTAAAALDVAEARGEIVVVEKEQMKAVRKQAFGFSLPSLSLFDRGDKGEAAEPLDRITATLSGAYRNGSGKWVMELEDGAVWVQTDSEALNRDAKKGSTIEIRKAAMGSFLVNVDKQRAIRATRTK
jgi:hypothetical protein